MDKEYWKRRPAATPTKMAVLQSQRSNESSFLKKTYMILYNLAALIGWSYFLYIVGNHFMKGGNAGNLWATSSGVLKIVQTSALLEILHSAFGLVKSSAMTVFVQGT